MIALQFLTAMIGLGFAIPEVAVRAIIGTATPPGGNTPTYYILGF